MDALYIIFLIKPQQLLISLLIDDDVCSMLHLITSSKPYNIFPPNFGILLLLKGSFQEYFLLTWSELVCYIRILHCLLHELQDQLYFYN